MPDDLRFVADVEIQAAADGKRPTVRILAYPGGPMPLPMGETVVELSGLAIPESVPLLSDHANERGAVVGQVQARVESGTLVADGFLTTATAAGREVVALAKDGVRLQASIGAQVESKSNVAAGATLQANGRSIKSPRPLVHVTRARLVEISLVPIGAAPGTQVDIVARKDSPVSLENTTPPASETPVLTAADTIRDMPRQRGIEATADRYIRSVPGRMNEVAAAAVEHIEAGKSSEEFAQHCLHHFKPERIAVPSSQPIAASGSPDVLTAALMLRCGLDDVAMKEYGERVTQQAHDLRLTSMADLAKFALQSSGRVIPAGRDEMIRAAFSTHALSTALSNTAGKSLLAAYAETPRTWAGFARVVSARDFKAQTAIRTSMVGELERVGNGGELRHASFDEATYDWRVDTFGKMLTISRTDLVNDDLSVFAENAPALGRMAARALNDHVWSTIMANGGSFFSSGNANLLEGGSALDIASLGDIVKTMRVQRDANDIDLDLMPKILAVPPELEVTARALLNSAELGKTDGTPTGNALKGAAELVVESRLSNTSRFTGASTTAYYLFAAPADSPVLVGYLDGKQSPTIETQAANFDVLGQSWRVYFDYGCALGDHRAAVKATGQA